MRRTQRQREIKYLAILLLLVIPATFYLAFGLKNPPEVGATGGAFPYTKHGGGTVDGMSFSGINRVVNPDYNLFYNDATGAGQYLAGECTHCHEPHGSFGGTEPDPTGSAPQRYLLMKYPTTSKGYAELCWYCHENINFNPMLNGGTGFWGFYQGKEVYTGSSHYTSSAFYWRGTSGYGDPWNIWPRQSRSGLGSGNIGSCLNCHTPHGIKSAGASTAFDTTSPDTTGGVPTDRQIVNCASPPCNPSVSADYLIPRQLIAWEENLCEGCHRAGNPPIPNIQDEINKRHLYDMYSYSGHPVDDPALAGRHVASEDLPITTKHVECYDCHNPHAVRPGSNTPGDGDGGRIAGMKYIDIDGTVKNPADGDRQPYIYEVCFKCHGDSYNQVFANDYPFPDTIVPLGAVEPYADAQNPGTHPHREGNRYHFSNKRLEFDPNSSQKLDYPVGDLGYNSSYHPVASGGLNGTTPLYYQLKQAFGCADLPNAAALSTLTIQCTDCHNNEDTGPASTAYPVTVVGPVTKSNLRTTDHATTTTVSPLGPHGSDRNRLLRGNYITVNSASGVVPDGPTNNYLSIRMDSTGRPKFELCFLCHQENVLLYTDNQTATICGTNYSGSGFYGTNFGSNDVATYGMRDWDANLHMYHLSAEAVCHDCHHNVHSNVEAQNTIYGDGIGGELPPDDHDGIIDGKVDTHLLNFGPQEEGQTATKPRWYWDGSRFRCNMICHGGYSMSVCYYVHQGSGQLVGGNSWCQVI